MKHAHAINQTLDQAIKHWKYLSPVVSHPHNEQEYNILVKRLDMLLEIVGEDENHPLISMVDMLSYLITAYEEAHFKLPAATGVDALKFLMASNKLTQSDLPDIASQGVMSEILNGRRALNLRQIKLLAKRFHVDPATFIDEK